MKIKVYADPGHAWAVVPRKLLHKLGIAEKITPYSYARGDKVYLEEDCDLDTFCRALEAHNTPYTFTEMVKKFSPHGDRRSRIRSYNRYFPEVSHA